MAKKLAKAFTWRLIGTAEVFVIAYFTTGHVETAGPIAGFTAISSTILYVVHEYAWHS